MAKESNGNIWISAGGIFFSFGRLVGIRHPNQLGSTSLDCVIDDGCMGHFFCLKDLSKTVCLYLHFTFFVNVYRFYVLIVKGRFQDPISPLPAD